MAKDRDYQIFTDPCSDLRADFMDEHDIGEFRMGLIIGNPENPKEILATIRDRSYTAKEFYDWMRRGTSIRTAQVTRDEYETKMIEALEAGKDILYIACSSALSGSVNLATLVANDLQPKYPESKIIIVDTLCGSISEGMLVYYAALFKKSGKSIEEVGDWVLAHRQNSNQFATVDTLKYMRKAGRVTGGAAFFGDIMQVKPIIISNLKGENQAVEKIKGKRKALAHLAQLVKNQLDGDIKDATVFVGHGDDEETVNLLVQYLKDQGFTNIQVSFIGPIVGATCGPGVIGVFILGKKKIA